MNYLRNDITTAQSWIVFTNFSHPGWINDRLFSNITILKFSEYPIPKWPCNLQMILMWENIQFTFKQYYDGYRASWWCLLIIREFAWSKIKITALRNWAEFFLYLQKLKLAKMKNLLILLLLFCSISISFGQKKSSVDQFSGINVELEKVLDT